MTTYKYVPHINVRFFIWSKTDVLNIARFKYYSYKFMETILHYSNRLRRQHSTFVVVNLTIYNLCWLWSPVSWCRVQRVPPYALITWPVPTCYRHCRLTMSVVILCQGTHTVGRQAMPYFWLTLWVGPPCWPTLSVTKMTS